MVRRTCSSLTAGSPYVICRSPVISRCAPRTAATGSPTEPMPRDNVEVMSHLEMCYLVGNHHLYRVDQFTMHFSIEGRFLFLDHEVVEFAASLPSSHKVRPGSLKHIVRSVAQRYIHRSCLDMEKKGFSLPMREWIAGPLRRFCRESLARLRERALVKAEAVDAVARRARSGALSSSAHLDAGQSRAVAACLRGYRAARPDLSRLSRTRDGELQERGLTWRTYLSRTMRGRRWSPAAVACFERAIA